MDDKDKLDPETQKALDEAMEQAAKDVRDDGVASMAAYMRTTYQAFRKCGFGRAQSYGFTALLYQNLLRRG